MEKKVLHLTLKKKWFDMILSGEKKEEYRELKPYWITRLSNGFKGNADGVIKFLQDYSHSKVLMEFDIVRFTNGYGKSAPSFDIEFNGIRIDNDGKYEWGKEAGNCFIISLGKILSATNIPEIMHFNYND